jgi:hypothetical protein
MDWIFDRDLIHYLNDFLLINDLDPEFFDIIISYLDLIENHKKRKDGWIIDFIDIKLDSDLMEIYLSTDKYHRIMIDI